jgi:DNA/RNA endonuclease G (NUC1)/PKD repeat protein
LGPDALNTRRTFLFPPTKKLMRIRLRVAAFIALTIAIGSCSENGIVTPDVSRPQNPTAANLASLPAVRVSEFHYDNTGTDTGEAIEISGPAGTDLTGWQLVLYNGNSTVRAPYNTMTLTATIPATCTTRGVVVISYPVNGIQNGGSTAGGTTDPDGFALVDAVGNVVEFLSYEGSFTALSGPAAGQTSTDIGIRELGTESASPVWSLKRDGAGVWSGPSANDFGVCNDNDEPPPPPAEVASVTVTPATATIVQGSTQSFTATAYDSAGQPIPGVTFAWTSTAAAVASVNPTTGLATGLAPGDAEIIAAAPNGVADTASLHVDAPSLPETRFSELHYDNFGTDAGEAIEIEGPAGAVLTGWSVVLYNGNGGVVYSTQPLTGTIPASCDARGVVVVNYPQDGIQNGSPDGFALINSVGQVVEFLSYEGTFTAVDGPAAGQTSTDIGVAESSSPVGQSLQRTPAGTWQAPATSSFGACYGSPPPPPVNTITFTGRLTSDPALPVGFEDQLFATLHDGTGAVIPTTFTWSSETSLIATIDQNGVMRALDAGSATFRATAADGTTATYTLPTRIAVASTTAIYAGNAEFGEPADADASDDFIVHRAQYISSYNKNRGTPNWVSYDLEATHFGAEDRCDCFTFDPELPADFTHYTTNDYTGAGTFHGYGIDRGHFARSFDRTSASLDNATTYYFSNIVPQASDLNQGPWALMENYLGDLARFQNKEVYIIAGVAGSKGTVKDEGKIVIPASTWKVAVILPRDYGLANIVTYTDLEVITVIMPNDPGVRDVAWETYKTTVDAVEALSGYDLLALLPDKIEIAVESGTNPPVAAVDGPYASLEGASVAMSGAGSSDLDGDPLTYEWTFGDGGTSSGVAVAHTYAQDGTYSVRLIVSDILGIPDTAITTATVSNVAPSINSFDGATLLPGETYSATGTFVDPGADPWSATVDYGDGSGVSALPLDGMGFSLSHTYNAAGTFTVTVSISDDDATAIRTQTVTVLTAVEGLQSALTLVDQLVAGGGLSSGNANSLKSKLSAAIVSLEHGNINGALGQLNSFLSQLDALVASGNLAATDADVLRVLVGRVIESISP